MFRFIEKVILEEEVSSILKPMFVEVGVPMEEMWEVIMPETSAMSHGELEGKPEKTAGLEVLLNRFSKDLNQDDRSWARDALHHHKTMISHKLSQNTRRYKPAVPYRRSYGGMPSVGAPFADGVMYGSDMSGGPPAGLRSLPSPWAASAS